MKIKEIRELTTKEIEERIDTEKNNLQSLKIQHAISPLDNTTQLKFIRRDIARMKTILRERELDQNK
jgi:large subunit ribosomal protein L29